MERDRIVIACPHICLLEDGARLEADVTFPDQDLPQKLWVKVDNEFRDGLVSDRLDGFLVWLLPYAMRHGCSIVCKAPVSRRLLYQLNQFLLPGLSNFIDEYKRIEIEAEACSDPVRSDGGVATGWTGGVDSMYSLWRMIDYPLPDYRLSHLVVMNCGALEGHDNSSLVRVLADDAKNGICRETGLGVVWIDSNIEQVTPEPFLSVSDFRLTGAVLCLQALFGKFYLSSSYEFATTRFFSDASCYYSLFSLPLLCTEATLIIPIGGALSRLDKIRMLADYPIAQKFLHPCIYTGHNCGHCDKCIRTETALYSIGKLDGFKAVFDVEEFNEKKKWYLIHLLSLKENQHCGEVISELVKRGEIFEMDVIQQARAMNCARKLVSKNREVILSKCFEK